MKESVHTKGIKTACYCQLKKTSAAVDQWGRTDFPGVRSLIKLSGKMIKESSFKKWCLEERILMCRTITLNYYHTP